jgi:hypothetical protein
MTLDLKYHIMAADAVEEHGDGTYEELSVVEFLRRLERREELPYDMTITGLDDYLAASEDPREAAEYVHTVLRDRVNFVLTRNPVVQFVVEDVEHWKGGGVIPVGEEKVRLVTIFGGSVTQEGPGWYSSEFNVQS